MTMMAPAMMSVTAREGRALADRLLSRAISTLGTASTEHRRDLKLASRLLRVLLREYSDREILQVDAG